MVNDSIHQELGGLLIGKQQEITALWYRQIVEKGKGIVAAVGEEGRAARKLRENILSSHRSRHLPRVMS